MTCAVMGVATRQRFTDRGTGNSDDGSP